MNIIRFLIIFIAALLCAAGIKEVAKIHQSEVKASLESRDQTEYSLSLVCHSNGEFTAWEEKK